MIPIPYVHSLDQLHKEIFEGIFPFVSFTVKKSEEGVDSFISHVTIPFCRFREHGRGLYVARSCDCEGTVCGHPTQKLYISKKEMENWKFAGSQDHVYTFVYLV